jgi:hypothetical protein
MSRFLKKLTHKYEFLKLELEEVKEEGDDYQVKWGQLFGKYFADKNSEFWVNEDTGELRKDRPVDETDTDEIEPKPEKPKKLRDLYKKLSKHTHPDKGGDEDEFNEVKQSYDKEDLLALLSLAGQYDIDFELEDEDQEMVEKSCLNIENEINNTKSTLSWAYFTGDNGKKKAVLAMMEHQFGITIDPKDIPEELL